MMKSIRILAVAAFAAWGVTASAGVRSWEPWYDTNGHVINAHGGGVMYDDGAYWWYGEHKVYGEAGNQAWVGVHAYRSTDLVTWEDRGVVLKVSGDSASEITAGCIIERPKVIRNPKSGNYVMYFHLELKGQGYSAAKTGIAVANRPEGPFVLLKTLRPNGAMSRDMTLFVDDDGKAYHFFSSEDNRTMHVDELTDDYLGYTGKSVRIFENDETEAPAVFKHGGWYWLIGSGCTGWTPNTARIYRAKSVTGPWERLGNPCRGRNPNNGMGPELTWGGQSTFVLPIAGRPDSFVAMFDIWRSYNQIDSRYIWMPVKFGEDGVPFIEWVPDWTPDVPVAAPAPATASFAEFDAKARRGEQLSVVFFGGSLTFSANASDPGVTGIRGLLADYLRARYPLARFTFHDAAIGGTGSLLGAFRLERDVLAHNPDLVFLDFLCNDGTDEDRLEPTCAYEYILRELIGRGIPVEQMFFTFKFWAGKGFDPVKTLPRRNFYRRLAEAYGTPSGDVQLEALGRDLESGKTTLDEVWPLDGAHPCDFGYRYFFEAVKTGFERGLAENAVCRVPEKPVYGTLTDVKRTRLTDGKLPEGWTSELAFRTSMWFDGLSARWIDGVARATSASAPLEFDAKCNLVGFFGEGDEKALRFTLSDEKGELGKFTSSPGGGRLFIYRTWIPDDWAKGAVARHFTVKPAEGKGDLRLESVMTATIVPADSAAAARQTGPRVDSVEALDHARGKKSN